MGLDWHSCIRATREYKEDYIRKYYPEKVDAGRKMDYLVKKYAPTTMKPCEKVGAKKMKDLPDFKQKMEEILKSYKERAEQEAQSKGKFKNEAFIKYWTEMTIEELMKSEADKWCCDECPLLKDLQGADSTGSFFLGVTVSSCDFRGKMIGADDEISDELTNEAYDAHSPKTMVKFANKLLEELNFLKESGNCEKESYEEYVNEYQNDPSAKIFAGEMLTEEEYNKQMHWREQNILGAVKWLKTCAKYGVKMRTSY